jgi:hypothetical protein
VPRSETDELQLQNFTRRLSSAVLEAEACGTGCLSVNFASDGSCSTAWLFGNPQDAEACREALPASYISQTGESMIKIRESLKKSLVLPSGNTLTREEEVKPPVLGPLTATEWRLLKHPSYKKARSSLSFKNHMVRNNIRSLRSRSRDTRQMICFTLSDRQARQATFNTTAEYLESYRFVWTILKNRLQEVRSASRSELNPIHRSIHCCEDGTRLTTFAGVHADCGDVAAAQTSRRRGVNNIRESNVPRDSRKHFGIEIEFGSYAFVAEALEDEEIGLYGHLKDDGSVDVNDPHEDAEDSEWDGGQELALLLPEDEAQEKLQLVGKILARAGADVNDSCGLHVHLDMRRRDVHKAFNNLVAMQHFLYKMVSPERRNSSYCCPLNDRKGRSFDKAPSDTRYLGISPAPYKNDERPTIEVRIHHGTVNSKEIYGWCKFLSEIVDAPSKLKWAMRTPFNARKHLQLSDESWEFMKRRLRQFGNMTEADFEDPALQKRTVVKHESLLAERPSLERASQEVVANATVTG